MLRGDKQLHFIRERGLHMSYKQRIANPIISAASRLGFVDAYGRLRSNLKSQVVILMYHRVGPSKDIWSLSPINTSDFEDQIRYLIKTHKILPLDELARCFREKRPLPRRTAAITFDDGYKDIFFHAYPILKKYNVPATIFLTTGHIGTGNLFWVDKVRYVLWNTALKSLELDLDELGNVPLEQKDRLQFIFKVVEKLKKVPEEKKNALIEKLVKASSVDIPPDLGKEIILSWDEVKEMKDKGITFGAHTVTHPILTKVSLKEAKYEITQSKKDIEERLDQSVTTFSYPEGGFGDFNTEIIDLLKETGFVCAVTTIPKMVAPKTDLYALGRISPDGNYNLFKRILKNLQNSRIWQKSIYRMEQNEG